MLEFKKFSLKCYRVDSTLNDYFGEFNIKKTHNQKSRIDWFVFDNDNHVNEGTLWNNPITNDLSFIVKLSSSKQYFILLNEKDDSNHIFLRTWEIINGHTLFEGEEENACTFSNQTNLQDNWGSDFDYNSTHKQTANILNKDSKWIFSHHNELSPFEYTNLENLEKLENLETDYLSSIGYEKQLDEMIEELQMLSIDRPTSQLDAMEKGELMNWEEGFIENLQQSPLIPHETLVENYYQTIIPHTPKTPKTPKTLEFPKSSTFRYYSKKYMHTQHFQDELKKVRDRVMGRKNEIIIRPEKRWYSFFK